MEWNTVHFMSALCLLLRATALLSAAHLQTRDRADRFSLLLFAIPYGGIFFPIHKADLIKEFWSMLKICCPVPTKTIFFTRNSPCPQLSSKCFSLVLQTQGHSRSCPAALTLVLFYSMTYTEVDDISNKNQIRARQENSDNISTRFWDTSWVPFPYFLWLLTCTLLLIVLYHSHQ